MESTEQNYTSCDMILSKGMEYKKCMEVVTMGVMRVFRPRVLRNKQYWMALEI